MSSRADPANYNLESVARTVSVLLSLEGSDGSSLDQVAHSAQLSESTTLRYLSSLATHELVERDPTTGAYRLGLALFRLGTSAIRQRDITSIARPYVEALRDRFQETVNLAARRANQVTVIQVLQSPRSLRKGVEAGGIDSWHATSLGKALLSRMTDADVDEIIRRDNPLIQFTPNSLATLEDLLRDLESTRSRGYAIDDEESGEGLRCVGVAIVDHLGDPRYALSLSGPKSRMPFSRLNEIGEELVVLSEELSRELGYVKSA